MAYHDQSKQEDEQVKPTVSPNGGSVRERQLLEERFMDRIAVNHELTRKVVSYQGNRRVPGLRWMKYKEGFSRSLVESLLDEFRPTAVLDPFAGLGTTPLIAAGRGLPGIGIDVMPVGVLVGRAIAQVSNGLSRDCLEEAGNVLMDAVRGGVDFQPSHSFPHVRITEAAFPDETEVAIARARACIEMFEDGPIKNVLNVACMTVLEDVSYTRKDGQYLRWDFRAERPLKSKVNKGRIQSFEHALGTRLLEMVQDADMLKQEYGGASPELLVGSSLEMLQHLQTGSVDMVITSPPYANRYDYTRTYALELAWLGYDQESFSELRQRMLSATVENKSKLSWLLDSYHANPDLPKDALRMYESQGAVHEALNILHEHTSELGNRHVIRLIEGYFLEMAVIVAELGRIVRPGGAVVMVNDNVQYHGEELPVDLILSDFAEQSGFACESIWTLPRGKGNSSQQMRRFGRRELRKCVYRWVRRHD